MDQGAQGRGVERPCGGRLLQVRRRGAKTGRLGFGGLTRIHVFILRVHRSVVHTKTGWTLIARASRVRVGEDDGDVQHVDRLAGQERTARGDWFGLVVVLYIIVQQILPLVSRGSNDRWRIGRRT